MSLTPEQVKQYRDAYGIGASKKAPTSTSSPSDRIAKLRGMVAEKKQETAREFIGADKKELTPTLSLVRQASNNMDTSPDMFGSPVRAVKEAVSGVGEAVKERGGKLKDQLDEIGKEKGADMDTFSGRASALATPRSLLRLLGAGAGLLGDVGFEALKLVTPQGIEEKVSQGAQAVGGTSPVQAGVDSWSKFEESNPKLAQDIKDVGNIASVVPIFKGTQKVGDVISDAGKKVYNASDNLDAFATAREGAKAEQANKLAGRVVQGTKEQQESAVRALSDIPTENIKTYEQLNETITKKVADLSEGLDAYLERVAPDAIPVEKMSVTKDVGGKMVSTNYVVDALRQLDELFTKTKDVESQEVIQQVIQRANAQGLTATDLNNLAKAYGDEFGEKAFSKITGEPLTSVNAQMFENVRKGLKETVRQTLPDDTAKMIDAKLGDLLETRSLTRKLEEKVSKVEQEVYRRGTLEKGARAVGRAVDVLSGHTISGFVMSFVKGNVGNKKLNALDIQEQLSDALKKLDEVLATKDKPDFTTRVARFLADYNKKAQVGMSVRAIHPEDLDIMRKYADELEAGNVSPATQKDFDRVAGYYDFDVPANKKDAVGTIRTMADGNEENVFDAGMDASMSKYDGK